MIVRVVKSFLAAEPNLAILLSSLAFFYIMLGKL